MKRLITLSFLLFSIVVFSQRKFEGKATYMSKRSMDMSRFDKMPEQQKKQMMARFKNFLEKTYTLSFNKSESAFKENVKLDAPGTGGGRSWGASNGQGSIYKNVKDRKMTEDIEQFSKRFRIVEEMEMPQWEMTGETRKIGQYTCYKATMVKVDNTIDWGSIFGRRGRGAQKKDSTKVKEKKPQIKTQIVTAWYTPQIPVSAGPAEYWGLPGLILEINAGRTTMLCTEIVINPEKSIEIKEPTKGKEVSRDEFNTMMKIKSEELRQQFQNRRGGRGRSN
jgi:GLPGLI family protein